MAIIIPNIALSNPFITDLPVREAISVSAKKVTEKYSHGPNFKVSLASTGDAKIITATPISVPTSDANTEIPSAFPASPLRAIGDPSKVVAIEAGVPGILRRIAEIKPPDIPPI